MLSGRNELVVYQESKFYTGTRKIEGEERSTSFTGMSKKRLISHYFYAWLHVNIEEKKTNTRCLYRLSQVLSRLALLF